MSSWFHTIKGRYNIAESWVGVQYSILDPVMAENVMFHELTHALIATTTDFGQATSCLVTITPQIKGVKKSVKDEFIKSLLESQISVQEGFATLIQIIHLQDKVGKEKAQEFIRSMPDDYQKWLAPLMFVFDLSRSYRSFFTEKVSHLAMENGCRADLPNIGEPKPDLINWYQFFSDENRNPNIRLMKMVETLRYKPWLVTKDPKAIANACGIKYYPPATKKEVAIFLSYLSKQTDNPRTISEDEIGDTPSGDEIAGTFGKNAIVGNMNLNLVETAEVLFSLEGFKFYSDVAEVVFIIPHSSDWDERHNFELLSGRKSDVGLLLLTQGGEKYLTSADWPKTNELLRDNFPNQTLMIKWGGYNTTTGGFVNMPSSRPPDLVVYNRLEDMVLVARKYLQDHPAAQINRLHMGVSEDHPVNTLLLVFDNQPAIHAVNIFGNRDLGDFIKEIEDRSAILTNDELKARKKHINNYLTLWGGFDARVDWVETSIDGQNLILKNGSRL